MNAWCIIVQNAQEQSHLKTVTAELAKLEIDDVVEYSQCQSTDQPTFITMKACTDEYIDTIFNAISDLATHSFISKCQSRYVKNCRENLSLTNCLIVHDFAEIYKFVIHTEIESLHSNNQQCTLHRVIIDHRD